MRKQIVIAGCLLLAACNKSPIERTRDAANGGPTGTFSGTSNFVVFSNELRAGGGAFFYPGGENLAITFEDRSNPISERSIRFAWNGQPTESGGTDHTFAGVDLMHTSSESEYSSTAGRDLRSAGYSRVTFFGRGSLSTNTVLKIEVADDGNESTVAPCLVLSSNGTDDVDDPCSPGGTTCAKASLLPGWQSYSISITNPALASVKDFFKATFIFNDPFCGSPAAGQGGTAFFDVIQYQP